MPKSAAFIRIKSAVLEITRQIPAGQVTSFKEIGTHLDVMPRHIAYLLAQLSDEEKATIPWYRVIPDNGVLDRVKYDGQGVSQEELLAAEGVEVGLDKEVLNPIFFTVNEATTGVKPIPREGN
jgi:methylated-DNA-protein-cysteine methyltransferase related protein